MLHSNAFLDDISDLTPIEKTDRLTNLMSFHIRKLKHFEGHKELSS